MAIAAGEDGTETSRRPRGLSPASPRVVARWIRQRLRHRPDSEHEQALIRIAFAFLIAVYVFFLPADLPDRAQIVSIGLLVSGASLFFAILLFLHILLHPQALPARRIAGMLIDTVGLNAMMAAGGFATALFYPILLWVILGHGFRFGKPYLFAAAGTSFALFALVIFWNAEWRTIPALDVALLLALVVLPAYCSVLIGKLNAAIARAEEASRVKSRFLAMMSHELRTPLNAIIGMADLLATSRLDADQASMTATIRSAARTLLALVNEILDLARLEEGRFVIERVPFDLDARLALLRSIVRPQAHEKGLYFRLELDPRTPSHLIGAVQPLHQILLNLLANAVKFTHSGGVTLAVRPLEERDGRIWLRFEVRDTGIGIPADRQKAIFERFTQADDAIHRLYGGSGLGLSIARELVTLIGGRIGVTSTAGRGSLFWVEAPFETAPDHGAETAGLAGRAVLLGLSRELAERVRSLGLQTVEVETPQAARRMLERSDGPRLLLVDAGRIDRDTLDEAIAGSRDVAEVVAFGDPERAADWPVLALFARDVDTETLRRCLRAALTPAEGGSVGRPVIAATARSARILVAEDNRTNQRVIKAILERAGHRVVLAEDGQAALERLEREEFDLVLMDLSMPGTTGTDAVRLLRFLKDPAELPPIVALSADATPESRETCRQLGFSAYLTKPVETAELLSTIERLVGAGERADPTRASPIVAPAEGGARVLDPARLRALEQLDDGQGFIAELVEDFLADSRESLERMRSALAAGDAHAFRQQAHALRSSAAHMGGVGVFELCLSWRGLDDAALVMRGRSELARLEEELAKLEQALRAHLRAHAADARRAH
ncbi:MAG: ATP-binding protein [Geminicoccaceae bacterium]|nr:ATP-binding protein [Geminicoccaceae bacterium]